MPKDVIIVKGRNAEGVKFRPSDWVECLASCAASYAEHKRLTWHQGLKPVYIDNEKCLAIDIALESIQPVIWNHVISFAFANNLEIIENYHDKSDIQRNYSATEAA